MEEDKIKDIFIEYDPELSSSMAFLEHLERNLNAVELIHRENAAVMKRNRLAVTIASCAGFITGVIFTVLYPYINALVQTLGGSILESIRLTEGIYYVHIVSWLLIGTISVVVALNTYTLSTTLLPHNQGVLGSSPSGTTQKTIL